MTKQSFNFKEKSDKRNKRTKRKNNRKSKKLTSKTQNIDITKKFQNFSNNKNETIYNIELISKNLIFYSEKLTDNHFEIYYNDILTELLLKETIENKKIINENILNKYNLTKEHRKNAFKYLYNFIKFHKFNIKCYFSTVSTFDLFLINFSEDESNTDKCKIFFNSKKTNEISLTKLILFELCCFYLTSKYYNIKLICLEDLLLSEDAKDEVNYDDLINLVDDIMIYTDSDICNKNIDSYIEIFMFGILKSLKNMTKNEKFLHHFENYVIFFSCRFVQEIHEFNILESIQVLGIIIFSFEFSKFSYKENNEILDNYLIQWKDNLKDMIKEYDANKLEYVINWLNSYVSYKYINRKY